MIITYLVSKVSSKECAAGLSIICNNDDIIKNDIIITNI